MREAGLSSDGVQTDRHGQHPSAAYAEAGRFPEAVATAESAVNLANAQGETHLADINNHFYRLSGRDALS